MQQTSPLLKLFSFKPHDSPNKLQVGGTGELHLELCISPTVIPDSMKAHSVSRPLVGRPTHRHTLPSNYSDLAARMAVKTTEERTTVSAHAHTDATRVCAAIKLIHESHNNRRRYHLHRLMTMVTQQSSFCNDSNQCRPLQTLTHRSSKLAVTLLVFFRACVVYMCRHSRRFSQCNCRSSSIKTRCATATIAYGHTTLNTPDLV